MQRANQRRLIGSPILFQFEFILPGGLLRFLLPANPVALGFSCG
jgi:hypothetical protein